MHLTWLVASHTEIIPCQPALDLLGEIIPFRHRDNWLLTGSAPSALMEVIYPGMSWSVWY